MITLPNAIPLVDAPARFPVRRGFTIVELIVVAGIIAVLVGILLVAFGGARRFAEQSSADRFVATIGQAVEAFERDLGYLPPLLVHDLPANARVLLGNDPPSPPPSNASVVVPTEWSPTGGDTASPDQIRQLLEDNRFGSEFTLAAYLLGTGDIDNSEPGGQSTGANSDDDDGAAGPGIRDPGPDRSWGGAGLREQQTTNVPNGGAPRAIRTGRIYGPYLDPNGLTNNLKIDKETGLFRLLDPWGQPVRFYSGWPTTTRPDPPESPGPGIDYTPVELRTAAALEAQLEAGEPFPPDLNLERPVLNAKFMILSAGKPSLFESDGSPIPLFGDRKRTEDSGASGTTTYSRLPEIQDCSTRFRPQTLNEVEREQMIEDLRSNVRYVP